ncbi:MAG: thioesterase family protein [Anaerovibrio sp.]|nr:thioesterase family protein [Anaerovibrio sp.]
MEQKIEVGLINEAECVVTAENTARSLGSGCLQVFATPAMCCLMEKAASDLLDSLLDEASTSVGISLQIAHTAATPVGMGVTAAAEITAVEGRRISFRVTARDEAGEIGSGTHERFIVFKEKFQMKADAKMHR